MDKTCFFIGHRNTMDTIDPHLYQAVEQHITQYGVFEFVVGGYGNFDRMAASAVKQAKLHHPEIALYLLTPYHPYDRPINPPEGFDGTYYPPGMESVPKRVAIIRANQYMVLHSTHLIAYVRHTFGGAYTTLETALHREKRGLIHITNLADILH